MKGIVRDKRMMRIAIWVIIIILLIVVGMRPKVPNGENTVYGTNLDIIMVVDNTLSMLAEDYPGAKNTNVDSSAANGNTHSIENRRIDGVISDVEYIINKIPGAKYALITFANESSVAMPLTVDGVAVVTGVQTMRQTDVFYATGSDIRIFKTDLERILKYSSKNLGRKRVVMVFSDGEETAEETTSASLADLKQYIDGGAVLGYGTAAGGRMQVDEFNNGNYTYIEDRTTDYPYEKAVSKIDEGNLRKMAAEMGVEYIHMDKQSDIDTVISSINTMKELGEGETEQGMDEIYYYFCPVIMVLFLIQLYWYGREIL